MSDKLLTPEQLAEIREYLNKSPSKPFDADATTIAKLSRCGKALSDHITATEADKLEFEECAKHDIRSYMDINKVLLNDMPCYRQWFWADDDDATCAHDDIDTENYCPACKLNELLSKQEQG